MSTYYDLSIPLRSLLILLFFCEMCVGGSLFPGILRRKNIPHTIALLLSILICAVIMFFYSVEARATLLSLPLPALFHRFCCQPVLLPLLVGQLLLGYLLYLALTAWRLRQNTISRSSIKEGVDCLSSGLCFYTEGGRVILSNRSMKALSFRIFGTDLQNGELFYRNLTQGAVCPEAERLSTGENPDFRLSDGSVWTFSREDLGGIYQLSAANTSQVQAMTDELKEKNLALSALNLRLRQYGENVDELTRSRERLEMKVRIHSELGQALLSTRHYLLEEEGAQPAPLELWQKNIAMLRKEAELREQEQPMEILSHIAAATGIETRICGSFPKNARVQQLFVQAAAEALTNAIRHAEASILFIDLQEEPQHYTACFRNNGIPPRGPLVEGGGLSSLRKKMEGEGGTMTLSAKPEFMLSITLPKEGGRAYAPYSAG